ncbi:hypothetical protein SODALDRAFT_379779 [Sodiomyces alkalinus F11]|uniref:Uncharacterized protein n=1 Tax=Sodiomyces alkalinus (strain CBS 110278 / VKM F-3762 / F11) TaxID=1314773 RepID=A0A3N2PS19_SODAK|nr:hypothetical protein SODALDRAFT_379779 [Sodiomyces alkalinus F11]ROT37311.1 hypothetical protein SODALDRAFT_379779 [Sodiomyces alkalinus F11]
MNNPGSIERSKTTIIIAIIITTLHAQISGIQIHRLIRRHRRPLTERSETRRPLPPFTPKQLKYALPSQFHFDIRDIPHCRAKFARRLPNAMRCKPTQAGTFV